MGFIDKPQALWWRKALFQIHLWSGIALGLYVLVISITGSALVFRPDLEYRAPKLRHTPAPQAPLLGFDEIASIALNRHSGHTLASVRNQIWQGRAAEVRLRKGRQTRIVCVDPYTGDVVADVKPSRKVLGFLQDLHYNLLAGRTGRRVNAIGGALLLVMSLSGMFVWWPGRRNWKRGLTVKWRAQWKRVNWDLHSAVGFWTLSLMVIWAVSGFEFGFARESRLLIGKFFAFAPRLQRPNTNWKPGDPIASLDRIVAEADRALPGRFTTVISLPAREGGVVTVTSQVEPSIRPLRADIIRVDPATGRVIGVNEYARQQTGDRILWWLRHLHYGSFGGVGVQVAWTILGLAPVALFGTGLAMWWNRVLSKKWARLRRGAAAGSSATTSGQPTREKSVASRDFVKPATWLEGNSE
jgi:uncharacterized iron-regulated membrane protein